jgi:hypothetical protein
MENQFNQSNQILLKGIETLSKNLTDLAQKIILNNISDNQQITKRNSYDDLQKILC